MGELVRKEGWDYPTARDTIDKTERRVIRRIYQETNQVFREAVTEVVSETEAIDDEHTRRFVAPFVNDSTRCFGNSLLSRQVSAMNHVGRVADAWRWRIRP